MEGQGANISSVRLKKLCGILLADINESEENDLDKREKKVFLIID